MRISDEMVEDIRNSASITEVIGHYIPLVKKGKGYTAVCPFHDDHDPSLSISEEKQIYKCFVCGKGGNVFRFVMDYTKCSFQEAVIEVAKIIGKPLNIEYQAPVKKPSKYQELYDAMQSMAEFTNYLLSSKGGQSALDYLNKRGLEKTIIDRFQIGYNPKDNVVYQYLHEKGYSDETMIVTNVARMTSYGMADVFYDRILFPIHDKDGHCIAFTARDITGRSESKYINTGATKIYTKGEILYNEHRAKEAIKKSGRVLVCEGVMDVIAFVRAGIENVVATLGTACSDHQLERLKALSNHLVLAYDGDNAGQNAILKLGKMALEKQMSVSVVDNQTGLDPDEIIGQYGEKALRDVVSHEMNFIDFAMQYYKKRYNLENYSDRKEVTMKVGELIDLLHDAYDRDNFENSLYELTKIHKIKTKQEKIEYNDKKAFKASFSIDGLTMAEYTILVEMSLSPRAMQMYQKELGCMLSDVNEALAILIIEDYRKYGDCNFSRLYDETKDEKMRALIEDLSLIDSLPTEFSEDILKGAICKVKQEIQLRKLEMLTQKIKEVSLVDPEKAQEYLKEYTKITKELGGTYANK